MKQTPNERHEEEEAIDIDTGDDSLPPGIPGDELIAAIEALDFSEEDVAEMEKAIRAARRVEHAG